MDKYEEKRLDYFSKANISDIDETSKNVIDFFNKFLNAVESGLEDEATKKAYELRLELAHLVDYIHKKYPFNDFNYIKTSLINQIIDLVKLIIDIINFYKIENVTNQKKKYLEVLFDIYENFFKWELLNNLDKIFFYSWAALNGLVYNTRSRTNHVINENLVDNFYKKRDISPLKQLVITSVACKNYCGDGQLDISNPMDSINIDMGINLVIYLIAINKKDNYGYAFDKTLLLSFDN